MTLERETPILSVRQSMVFLAVEYYTDPGADRVYTSSPRQTHAGHMMTGSPENYYRPRNLWKDGQAAYFGDAPLSLVIDLFRAMTLSRNLELRQSLPAEKQHGLESSAEFTEIEEKLDRL